VRLRLNEMAKEKMEYTTCWLAVCLYALSNISDSWMMILFFSFVSIALCLFGITLRQNNCSFRYFLIRPKKEPALLWDTLDSCWKCYNIFAKRWLN
jgi:hypothetical protein